MKSVLTRFLCCFCVLLFCGAAAFALPAQKILYPGDSAYDDLTALSLEQRLVFLSGSPLTVAQAELMFARINDEELSPAGKLAYQRLHDYLAKPATLSGASGILGFDFNPALQPEFYVKTEPDLNWIYDHNQRQPLLLLPVAFSLSSYVTLAADIYLGENRMISNAHDNYFNSPFDKSLEGVQGIDINAPKRAYMSAGFPFGKGYGVNFKIGIGDDTRGRTRTGSIIFSDNMRGLNYANLTLYGPRISYEADVMELEVTKYLYMHQLQLGILDRLHFSLIEGVMVNAPFEIRYLNPMMIFHSFTSWATYAEYNKQNKDPSDPVNFDDGNSRTGSLLGIALDYRPFRYGRFYGLFAMNQLELPGERTSESIVPDSLAFQWGYESWIPLSLGNRTGHVSFGLEGVYINPYMYILGHKGWSFFRESYEMDNPAIREWVGSSFGPDSAAGTFWVGYQDAQQWSASLGFLFLAQGENADVGIFDKPAVLLERATNTWSPGYVPHSPAEATASTPTGTPSYSYVITLQGKWSPLSWLNLSMRPGYKIVANHNHITDNVKHGFELAFSARLAPDLRRLSFKRKN
ncbi:hypothetical protein AGMMS49546_21850 [Spirochaetia bacterium]|nr:hypothetical protein AGMMS49546_21850 [Spirochaetia bacterium]